MVTKVPQHLVDVFLFRPDLATWPLELNEERAATWDEEHSVGPAGLTSDVELEVPDPHPQRVTTDLLLDLGLKRSHGSLCLSRHGAQTPLTRRPDHSPQRSQSPGLPAGIRLACSRIFFRFAASSTSSHSSWRSTSSTTIRLLSICTGHHRRPCCWTGRSTSGTCRSGAARTACRSSSPSSVSPTTSSASGCPCE